MAVAFIALLLALSGASYAAVKLPARSVGARELKPRAVTRAAIGPNAVDGSKVKADALTGSDIKEASLAQVPSAAAAASAAASTHAAAAAALDRVTYRGVIGSVAVADPTSMHSVGTATAGCDAGQVVTGGGVKVDDPDNTAIVDSFPDGGGRAWTARVDNSDTAAAHNFSVFAICVAAGSVG
jgi:ribosomal protein L12E/L44/L45/RPP1/RPP2